MSKLDHLPDGFYLMSNGNPQEACVIKLYGHPDFGAERHVVFGVWDGGGALPVSDVPDDVTFSPLFVHGVPLNTTTSYAANAQPPRQLSPQDRCCGQCMDNKECLRRCAAAGLLSELG